MDKRIEAAWKIIENEYQKPLTVRVLAARVALSRSHFEFLFKKETRVTMKACLRGVRLEQAAELLGQDHLSVKQVAYSVGYHHASSFARDFKRRFGMTASDPQTTRMPQITSIQEAGTQSAKSVDATAFARQV
ncbi:MAG: helix-turn-helix domain-containing protein [Terriglobia bacterium]